MWLYRICNCSSIWVVFVSVALSKDKESLSFQTSKSHLDYLHQWAIKLNVTILKPSRSISFYINIIFVWCLNICICSSPKFYKKFTSKISNMITQNVFFSSHKFGCTEFFFPQAGETYFNLYKSFFPPLRRQSLLTIYFQI